MQNASLRKTNELIKRARAAKVHALLVSHLRSQMPAVFWKEAKQVCVPCSTQTFTCGRPALISSPFPEH